MLLMHAQLKRSYSTYRYELHRRFKKYSTPQEARRNLPVDKDVTQEDWNFLVDLFSSETFMRNPVTGELLDMYSLWRETHYNSIEGEWVDEVSQQIYERAEAVIEEEGAPPMTAEEKFASVLGEKSGYVRGLGAGPKPKSMSKKLYREELQREFDEKLQQMETKFQAQLEAEVQAQVEAKIDAQVEARVEARLVHLEASIQARVHAMYEQEMRSFLFPPSQGTGFLRMLTENRIG